MLRGAQSVATAPPPSKARGITSDLSVDEGLLLHAAGWEPLDLVVGVAVCSIPYGVWSGARARSIGVASDAHNGAVRLAVAQIRAECSKVQGHGVVGVRVEVEVRKHHVDVELVGTAVRPIGPSTARTPPWQCPSCPTCRPATSPCSSRRLDARRSGLRGQLRLRPRRTAGAAMRQSTQNVELTNFTEAMYSARESAMERMQHSALEDEGEGVVEVRVTEGPMDFAKHAVGFTAWGTTVKLVAEVAPVHPARADPAAR